MPFKAFGVHGTVKVAATRRVTLQISKDTQRSGITEWTYQNIKWKRIYNSS